MSKTIIQTYPFTKIFTFGSVNFITEMMDLLENSYDALYFDCYYSQIIYFRCFTPNGGLYNIVRTNNLVGKGISYNALLEFDKELSDLSTVNPNDRLTYVEIRFVKHNLKLEDYILNNLDVGQAILNDCEKRLAEELEKIYEAHDRYADYIKKNKKKE